MTNDMANPADPSAIEHNERGIRLAAEGKLEDALAAFRNAIRLNPRIAAFYANIGAALGRCGKLEEALAALRTGIRIDPSLAELHNILGIALQKVGDIDGALDSAATALSLDASRSDYHYNFGFALELSGDMAGAFREFSEALRLNPGNLKAADSLAFVAHFNPSFDAAQILEVCSDWSRRFETPHAVAIGPHGNDPNPDRRLRIGYVSPMFCRHAEAHFVLPLLESHDRARFEVHCFSNTLTRDGITERHRRAVDGWHEIHNMSDEEAAQLVRDQRIDILVDLAMHLSGNRLGIFARKPAPVQMTWIAYPGTTGLSAIDYRLTDPIIDPIGAAEFYSEKSLRLPISWCCYDPLSTVGPRRAGRSGHIRYGSFNNPFKLNEPILRLWGRVLQHTPGSHLTVASHSARQRAEILRILGELGIANDRITFARPLARDNYLRRYDEIDIALDTLPYNGITTSCDALWMGVPVVTLKGKTAAGRAGASLLTAAGLPELIADTEDRFIEIAAKLAGDSHRLQVLHADLCSKLEASALMDRKAFAAKVEGAFRSAWVVWTNQDA
jgi:protein O-GlcNAc transferase